MLEFDISGRPLSWNKIYASPHWSKRKKLVDDYKWQVKLGLLKFRIPATPVKSPCKFEFDVFVKRSLDCDNVFVKGIIDYLRDWGYLPDDNPKWVKEITVRIHLLTTLKEEYVHVIIKPTPYGF